jgi:hypothetical protein
MAVGKLQAVQRQAGFYERMKRAEEITAAELHERYLKDVYRYVWQRVRAADEVSADLVRGTIPVALTGTLVFAVRVLASRGWPRPRLASVRVEVAPHGPTFADKGPGGGHHGGT